MLAHLMGHICLGHAYCDHRHSYHEWQAAVFSTELLMPEKILIHLLYTRFHRQSDPETITELANLFKVLPQAMFVRIKEILK